MADQRELTAAIVAQHQGMDASVHASMLPATKFARGVNLSIRGGFVRTRPGFREFSSDIPAMLTTGAGDFQGAGYWRTPDGVFVVTAFGGVVRRTALDTGVTVEIGPYLGEADTVHTCQAGPYFVMHGGGTAFVALGWVDGTHTIVKTPLVPESMLDDSWDDSRTKSIALSARIAELMAAEPPPEYSAASAQAYAEMTADGLPSYPPGTVCCFAHGRIHLSVDEMDHRYFFSSDILGLSDQTTVLKWFENMYLNSGGGLGLPDSLGEIRGMAVLQNSTDTASGIGPLIVLAQDGAAAFSVNLPREGVFDMSSSAVNGVVSTNAKLVEPGWKDRQIAQVLFYGGGTEAPWSLARVNGDLLYRSQDGIRTVRSTVASASSGASVANAPMSAEVRPFMQFDAVALQDRVSSAAADNRVLVTAGREADHYRGLVSLDLCVMATLESAGGGGSRAVGYDGLWTGLDVAKVLSAGEEFVVIATDGRMYRIVDDRWDVVAGVRRDIECQWETVSLNFGAPGVKKRLGYVEMWVREMTGGVSLNVYFRPDNFSYWTAMDGAQAWSIPAGGEPQERRRVRFRPRLTNDYTHDGSIVTTGEAFQFLVVWTGSAAVHRLVASAYAEADGPPRSADVCDYAAIAMSDGQIVQDDFSYPGA